MFDLGPAEHTNELGVQFWLDRSLTKYAREPDINGTTLPDFVAWITLHPDGKRERLLTRNGAPVFATQKLEDAAVRIDMEKAHIRYGKEKNKSCAPKKRVYKSKRGMEQR